MLQTVAPDVAKPCADRTELFYESAGERKRPRREREEQAKALCGDCPVRGECLAAALAGREEGAVWGGLNDEERRELARNLQPAGA